MPPASTTNRGLLHKRLRDILDQHRHLDRDANILSAASCQPTLLHKRVRELRSEKERIAAAEVKLCLTLKASGVSVRPHQRVVDLRALESWLAEDAELDTNTVRVARARHNRHSPAAPTPPSCDPLSCEVATGECDRGASLHPCPQAAKKKHTNDILGLVLTELSVSLDRHRKNRLGSPPSPRAT